MRNKADGQKQNRGSSPPAQENTRESDDWGVDWIQRARHIRDDEPGAESTNQVPDERPNSASPVVNDAHGGGDKKETILP